MATPVITPLPPAPTPSDSPGLFAQKSGTFVTAEVLMVPEINASLVWTAEQGALALSYKNSASASAAAASGSEESAAG